MPLSLMNRLNETKPNVSYLWMLYFIRISFLRLFTKDRFSHYETQMSSVMRKPTFCICENKDADQFREREADQRLCFRNIDSTIPLLSKSEISSI